MSQNFCEQCGSQLEDGMRFCTECGSPIADEPPIQQTEQLEIPPVEEPTMHLPVQSGQGTVAESASASISPPEMPQPTMQQTLAPPTQQFAVQQPATELPGGQYTVADASGKPARKGKGKTIAIVIAAIAAVAAIVLLVMLVVLPAFSGVNTQANNNPGQNGETSQAQSAASSTQSTDANANAQSSSSEIKASSPPIFTNIQVSSSLPPDKDTVEYGAPNLTDGSPTTAWNEGSPGDGSGEYILMSANSPQLVSSVSIMGGYPKLYKDGTDLYYMNSRPRNITVSYNGGSEHFTLLDQRGKLQAFTLSKPVATTELKITIDSVYKGMAYDDCCIAEVKVS